MFNRCAKILVLASCCLFSFNVLAGVTLVHEYSGEIGQIGCKGDECKSADTSCVQFGPGWYDTKKGSNYTSFEQKTIPNTTTKCYKTICSNKYIYSPGNCKTTGFKNGTACTDSLGQTYYDTCPCASGYYSPDKYASINSFDGVAAATNTITADRLKTSSLTCYELSKLTCKSTYKTVDDKPTIDANGKGYIYRIGNFIKYPVISPLKSSNAGVVCAGAPTFLDPLHEGAVPATTNKCANITKDQKDPIWSKTYWYYNGNCSTDDNCGTTTDACIVTSYSTSSILTSANKKSSVNCHYATGCRYTSNTDGTVCAGPLDNPKISSSYFKSTSAGVGSGTKRVSCQKVTGCATGYENVYKGTTAPTSAYTPDKGNVYDVQTVKAESTAASSYYTCRKHTGCDEANGYYDFACGTGCWDGWLHLWAAFPKPTAIPCVAGAWVDRSTKLCYASAGTGHDTHVYLNASYDVAVVAIPFIRTYTNASSVTALCTAGLTLDEIKTLAASATFRSAINAPYCVVGSAAGKIYNISASGSVTQANTSQVIYEKDAASGGCVKEKTTALGEPTFGVSFTQTTPYAFAAVTEAEMQCACDDGERPGNCFACPSGCTLKNGYCYMTEEPDLTVCKKVFCNTCNAAGTACIECMSGYTLSGGECVKNLQVNGTILPLCKVAK